MKYYKKNIFFILVLLLKFSICGNTQIENKIFDFRLGIGVSLISTGDIKVFNFENELNYKFNKYLSSSAGIKIGQGLEDYYSPVVNFVQGNINIYFSPFKNTNNLNFRIGSGLSYYSFKEMQVSERIYNNGEVTQIIYQYNERNSFGFNLITDLSYSIHGKFILGVELFIQPYFVGDINSGCLFVIGYSL